MKNEMTFPSIVATLHSPACLKKVTQNFKKLSHNKEIDLLEVRLDCLPLQSLLKKWPLPVIATARHPAEGGDGNLSLKVRRQLLENSFSWCSAIDVELRSAKQLKSTIEAARAEGKKIILSFHDFKKVPTSARLQELALRAKDAGANLFKVAATINDEVEFLRLIEFQQSEKTLPLATMGMGEKFGNVSRLVLPAFESTLVYGWYGKPQLAGQWSAEQVVQIFTHLLH